MVVAALAQRHGGPENPPYRPGPGVLDCNRVSGQLHRGHAVGGRLSDVYGRVRMFQAALVVFSIGSALVALAPNFPWIVSARVLQAFGGGATIPIGLAMAVAAVAPEKRGVALGLVAASAEAGSVLGPLYGGAIIELIGWRWIFWLDVPQSLILIALLAILPNRANPGAKMDYFGALALGASLHPR